MTDRQTGVVLLIARTPERAEAERIGEALVEQRLAASGSVPPPARVARPPSALPRVPPATAGGQATGAPRPGGGTRPLSAAPPPPPPAPERRAARPPAEPEPPLPARASAAPPPPVAPAPEP